MTARTIILPAATVVVSAVCDSDLALALVTIDVVRDGGTVASFGQHDVATKVRPENRAAILEAVAQVVAEVEASAEYAANVAAVAASNMLDADYSAHHARIINAGQGRCA